MVSIFALVVMGHNFWLIAARANGRIRVKVITSDKFPDSDSAIKPERVADFRLITTDGSTSITDYRVEGNSMVADLAPIDGTCGCIALELHPHPITLEAEKFGSYIRSEGADEFVAPGFTAGETTETQRESYSKYAKVLVGENDDEDITSLIAGHKLEIVPLIALSQIGDNRILPVKVLFDGKPIEKLRVSTGCEGLGGGKYLNHSQTNADGMAHVQITGDGHWYVRTHHIRRHPDPENFEWESFWASVTFRI